MAGLESNAELALPYEVLRSWPTEWDMLSLLSGDSLLPEGGPGPTRYLHPALVVKEVLGKGRGVVATRALEVGELVLLDSPLATASSHAELLDVLTTKATGSDAAASEFRRQLLSMCGDPEHQEARTKLDTAPTAPVLRAIVRHNYHGVDKPPIDGDLTAESSTVGLWPLGSLINHALRPNVTRSFAGHANCYRVIKAVAAGEEILDNYLDVRLPSEKRKSMLRSNHGISDEGPDCCDAPDKVLEKIQAAHAAVTKELEAGTMESAQSAFPKLAEVSNMVDQLGIRDPAFTDVFRDFALVAGQLGDANLSIQGCAQALEFVTAREPFNVISLHFALRMLHMACLAVREVDEETRTALEALAREHFRVVYGATEGAFELLNPGLTRRLRNANAKAGNGKTRKRTRSEAGLASDSKDDNAAPKSDSQ